VLCSLELGALLGFTNTGPKKLIVREVWWDLVLYKVNLLRLRLFLEGARELIAC
jgi:hypothetical protein